MRLIFLLGALLSFAVCADPKWTHVEYGGANVVSGNTVASENKLELQLLKDTLKALATATKNKGKPGRFYVNDLNPIWTAKAANALMAYAISEKLDVEVVALPGDFMSSEFAFPTTDTAHLKNPPTDLVQVPEAIWPILNEMANHSKEGLVLVSSMTATFDAVASHTNDAVASHTNHRMTKVNGDDAKYRDPQGKLIANKPTARYVIKPDPKVSVSPHLPVGLPCPINLKTLHRH